MRGLRVVEGRVMAPDGVWQNYLYVVTFPKGKLKESQSQYSDDLGLELQSIQIPKKYGPNMIFFLFFFKMIDEIDA